MRRPSRTFKLRLSPAGMDLLIDSHCHLIRSTRALLAWGTTLQVAVDYLDTVPVGIVREQLGRLPERGLVGEEEHHLGAPQGVNDVARRIAVRVQETAPESDLPTLASIYLTALSQLTRTDAGTLRAVYAQTKPISARLHRRSGEANP